MRTARPTVPWPAEPVIPRRDCRGRKSTKAAGNARAGMLRPRRAAGAAEARPRGRRKCGYSSLGSPSAQKLSHQSGRVNAPCGRGSNRTAGAVRLDANRPRATREALIPRVENPEQNRNSGSEATWSRKTAFRGTGNERSGESGARVNRGAGLSSVLAAMGDRVTTSDSASYAPLCVRPRQAVTRN
jgi:hypothetical protein